MSQGEAVILLAGRPGHLRDALQSLLHVMPGLKMVTTADTGLLALKTIREFQPDLVLVGSGWPDAEVLELIRQIKQEQPATQCLVLTEKSQQYHRVVAAGADAVLSSGLPIEQIFSTVKQMLANITVQNS